MSKQVDWIPVEERLPEEFHDVLAYSDADATAFRAHRMGVVWECDDGIGRLTGDITDWMPLPPRPNAKAPPY